ncbi:MAG TPA: hypothetical protein VMD30_00020 [Tepidisphaeraceae bacterium]|nr:hypothetical protein [Tepidisphaeraceae bacterium]
MKSFVEALENRQLLSTYYVDTNAAPGGNGSLTSPWQSIEQVNAFAATSGFQFGDHIRFHGGEIFSGTLILSQNGTRANPIVINSYDRATGNATIAAGNGSGIIGRDISGIIIANLNITGTSRADPQTDAATLADPASAGDTSITLTNAAGITPGQQLDIDRFTDGASTHEYEEAFVAYNYVPGSTTVPLQQPLLFNHSTGIAVNWDVDYGIAFIADDGAQHPRGVTIHGLTITGIAGVYPSAGMAFIGDGLRNGQGIDPASGSQTAYSVADSGFQAVAIHNDTIARSGPTGILFTGDTFSGSTNLDEYANSNLRVAHVVVKRAAFANQTEAQTDAAMEGPLNVQTGASGILVFDSQTVFINEVQTMHNGAYGAGGGGLTTFASSSVEIAHVESAFNTTGGDSGGYGFDLDGGVTNSAVEYSYSHDNAGPGMALNESSDFDGGSEPANSQNTFGFNISQDDARENGGGAISIANAGADNTLSDDVILANSVYLSAVSSGTQPVVVSVDGQTSGIQIVDNIFYAVSAPGMGVQMATIAPPEPATTTNVQFLRNDYWPVGATAGAILLTYNGTAYTDLSTWEQQTGQEVLSSTDEALSVDPQFKDAGGGGTLGDGTPADAGVLNGLIQYHILPTSPLIAQGLDPSTLDIDPGESDFYGHLLPPSGGYALGADQR